MTTTVTFSKKLKLKNAVLLVGLPGIGLVGKIAVDYLLKEVKASKIADITSDAFPPSVHTKQGLLEFIKDELFHFKLKGKDFVLLVGPVQPSLDARVSSMQEHYEFADAIITAAKSLGVNEVYTLAGLNVGEKRVSKEPNIIVAATDKKTLGQWTKLGAKSDQPEGLISGAAGLLLGFAQQKGMHGACLMGETNPRLVYGDHGSAKKILEILIKQFGFKVDLKKIKKESENIKKAFTQMQKTMEAESGEDEIPKEGLSYIR